MKKTNLFAIAILFTSVVFAQETGIFKSEKLQKTWETSPGLLVPESVCYDPSGDVIFVSNINGKPTDKDENGFISLLSTDGQIIELRWISGLNAPKGMGIINGMLYVSDIDRVAVIDIKNKKILKFYEFPEAIDLDVLNALEDQTEMTVVGSLSMPDVLPNDLLERKVKRIFVLDEIVCRGENAGFIKTHLVNGSGSLEIVPQGFERVVKPLVLDALVLQSLKTKKLYCTERVQIDPEVTAAQLDEGLEAIQSQEMILCPKALQSVLAQKCDLLKNQVVFYEGALWLVDDSRVLYASYLDAQQGKMTLVVTGELSIEADLDEKVLAEHLAKVHNLGLICCTPKQMGVIQARLGLQDGTLQDSTQVVEDNGDENQIGNANYLAL